eukprot:gene23970-29540_t
MGYEATPAHKSFDSIFDLGSAVDGIFDAVGGRRCHRPPYSARRRRPAHTTFEALDPRPSAFGPWPS